VVEQATLACQVTHLHREGVAGGVAVALAAAYTGWCRLAAEPPTAARLFDFVLDQLPDSEVRRRVDRARQLLGRSAAEVAFELGNGSRVLAQDTVPFTTWAAATNVHDYRRAVLTCVEVGGDIDTTGAIVGGIVSLVADVPPDWLAAREPLPSWAS
jgi:ADP-ribosylglycohydrolase